MGFTVSLLLLALVLLGLALLQRWVERWYVSPALLYLAAGAAAAGLWGGLPMDWTDPQQAAHWVPVTEAVVLISLFTVGLRLRQLGWPDWRLALLLASVGMLLTIGAAGLVAWVLLPLPWIAALVLATMLAPTDPVLASEVQVRSPEDRDALRLTLSAEGGLNDGSALPVMLLLLGLSGVHVLGPWGLRWMLMDLLWSVGGGVALGWLLGRALDHVLRRLLRAGHPLSWDELIYVGVIALAYGLARWTATSAFLLVFATGVAMFWRGGEPVSRPAEPLDLRLLAFGARCERLLEAAMVLLLGMLLVDIGAPSLPELTFAALLLLVLRPLVVLAVLPRHGLSVSQRRLVAWFGVRGVGSLFYLVFALQHALPSAWRHSLISACVWTLALSILLHGVSSTPLMSRQRSRAPEPPTGRTG